VKALITVETDTLLKLLFALTKSDGLNTGIEREITKSRGRFSCYNFINWFWLIPFHDRRVIESAEDRASRKMRGYSIASFLQDKISDRHHCT
jgi:hypothetical protein